MIPKVIHYCWFGGKALPAEVEKCLASWKKYCPDYEIRQWNESNVDIHSHPFMESAYQAKAWAFVSDYARLKVIYENGGIYLDTDVELLKNLDFLLENEFYIGAQQLGHLCTTGLGFGAEKGNGIVARMLAQYDGLSYQPGIKEKLACPILNARVFEELGYRFADDPIALGDALILPPRYLDPIAPGKGQADLLCEDTVSIHHYSASWGSKSTVLRRKLIMMIGIKRIAKLKHLLKR